MSKNKCDGCELDLMHEKCETKIAFLESENADLRAKLIALRDAAEEYRRDTSCYCTVDYLLEDLETAIDSVKDVKP